MAGNGRVHIPCIDQNTQFQMYDKIETKNLSFRDSLTGIWKDSKLSCAFFSKENVNYLNMQIINGIKKKTNGKFTIGVQDQAELQIIMRAIFLQSAQNLPNNITQQINDLNLLVLNYAIPQIYSSVVSYTKYLSDITNMYTLMERPTYSDRDGKTIELKHWF